jgi:hypothetical protein
MLKDGTTNDALKTALHYALITADIKEEWLISKGGEGVEIPVKDGEEGDMWFHKIDELADAILKGRGTVVAEIKDENGKTILDYERKPMEESDERKKLKEAIRKVIRQHLKETHYPPKSLDYNKLPDTDGFWNWPVAEAAHKAGLNPIGSNIRTIGDIIMWLNIAALQWERHNGK